MFNVPLSKAVSLMSRLRKLDLSSNKFGDRAARLMALKGLPCPLHLPFKPPFSCTVRAQGDAGVGAGRLLNLLHDAVWLCGCVGLDGSCPLPVESMTFPRTFALWRGAATTTRGTAVGRSFAQTKLAVASVGREWVSAGNEIGTPGVKAIAECVRSSETLRFSESDMDSCNDADAQVTKHPLKDGHSEHDGDRLAVTGDMRWLRQDSFRGMS